MWLAHLTLIWIFLSSSSRGIEASKCTGHIIPKVLTAKAGIIATQNFPNPFPTPYCERWVIDAGPYDPYNPKYIHLYYTQAFVKTSNFLIGLHPSNPFDDTSPTKGKNLGPRDVATARPPPNYIYSNHHDIKGPWSGYSTRYPDRERYFSIDVKIPSLWNTHFRTQEFLHVYGFNLTYEITSSPDLAPSRCGIYRCSAAGNCYATRNYTSFYCDCLEGRSGDSCEHSPLCDPDRDRNPCANGAKCETLASGSVVCYCEKGFYGQTCERRSNISIKSCPGPDCLDVCDDVKNPPSTRAPCSCHNGGTISNEDWTHYEVGLSVLQGNTSSPFSWNMFETPSGLTENDSQAKNDMELNIQKLLQELIPELNEVRNLSIVKIGPNFNSKFDFQFLGPPNVFANKSTLLALERIFGREIYENVTLGNLTSVKEVPRLELVEVSKRSGGTIKEHDNFSITCTARGANLTFKWFKERVPIDTSAALVRDRLMKLDRLPENHTYRSTLNIDDANAYDKGNYTCQVSDNYGMDCKEFQMDVLTKPELIVRPLSLTVLKNSTDIAITCVAIYDGTANGGWLYNWRANGSLVDNNSDSNEVKEELFTVGSILKIKVAQVSKIYTCYVVNEAGVQSVDVDVRVLNSINSPACANQTDRFGFPWDLTAPGQIAKGMCPPGYSGFLQRRCEIRPGYINPEWGITDFSHCESNRIRSVEKSLRYTALGFQEPMYINELPKLLYVYLRDKTKYRILYPGEGARIIAVMNEMANYAVTRGNRNETRFIQLYLNATTSFLSFPESVFSKSSIFSLVQSLFDLTYYFGYAYQSEALAVQKLQMGNSSSPLIFSNRNDMYPNWLDFQLEIPSNNRSSFTSFGLVILRNLTFPILSPKNIWDPLLISPIVYINSKDYIFTHGSNLILRFKISEPWSSIITNQNVNAKCSSIGDSFDDPMHSCEIITISSSQVVCQCDRFGKFGLLINPVEQVTIEEDIPLHWTVTFGCISCIICCSLALTAILLYSHCQIVTDSVYLLKIVVCFSIIICILFVLSLRVESSSVPLTTCLCTFLILSLSCHLTSSLKSFRMHSGIGINDPFPWLRFVPLVNLLLGITLTLVLPVWTAAATTIHSHPSVGFDAKSPMFIIFVGVLLIIVGSFFLIYFLAMLQLKKNKNCLNSAKFSLWDYKIRTLNRALLIMLATVIATLTGILHASARNSITFQYLFGLATFVLGLVVFLSYTIKSEYPIPIMITEQIPWIKLPDYPDPEKPSTQRLGSTIGIQNSRTPKNRCANENGHVAAIMLQNSNHLPNGSKHSSEPETVLTWTGSNYTVSDDTAKNRASSFASSNGKRSSIDSNNSKILRSNTDPPNFNKNNDEVPLRSEWHNLKFHDPPEDKPKSSKLLSSKYLLADASTDVKLPELRGSAKVQGSSSRHGSGASGSSSHKRLNGYTVSSSSVQPLKTKLAHPLATTSAKAYCSRNKDEGDYVPPGQNPGVMPRPTTLNSNPSKPHDVQPEPETLDEVSEETGNFLPNGSVRNPSSHKFSKYEIPTNFFYRNEQEAKNKKTDTKYPPLLNGHVHTSESLTEDLVPD